jgi:NAD(P)-dependent dehydrogenase (short-subunit alcohol dehydrogenase family)
VTRTILITGCSSGIGRASALAMRDRGWRVFATARRPEDLAALQAAGLKALYLDYADEASVAAAAEAVFAATGGALDALFNNGAYAQPGALEDLPSHALRAQFDANFFGWHALTRLVVPVMRGRRSGRIVFNSSVLGLIALGFRGAYTCSKWAVEAYADTLRIEVADAGVHVCVIEPGPIRTNMTATALRHARQNIDTGNSVHRAYYRRRLASMERGGNTRGQLEPEAVVDALVHACESRRPRPQYFVTTPTRLIAALKRVAPKRRLDAFLAWATLRS